MADADHVRRAGYAIAVWNRWREENPGIRPDLSGANLNAGLYRKGKLFAADLRGTDFRRSNLREADLHDSDLREADLSKTDLRGADLSGADLTGAELDKANLAGARLCNAKLHRAALEKAHCSGADLTGAELVNASLIKTDLETAVGLTQAQVDETLGDSSTQLPSGLHRPASWPALGGEPPGDA